MGNLATSYLRDLLTYLFIPWLWHIKSSEIPGPAHKVPDGSVGRYVIVTGGYRHIQYLWIMVPQRVVGKPLMFKACSQCLKITQNVAFEFGHFSPIFGLLKMTGLVTLLDYQIELFKKTFLAFCPLKMYLARFARDAEWDFFCDFQTLCLFEVEGKVKV